MHIHTHKDTYTQGHTHKDTHTHTHTHTVWHIFTTDMKKDVTLKQAQIKTNSPKAKKQPTNKDVKISTVGDIDE